MEKKEINLYIREVLSKLEEDVISNLHEAPQTPATETDPEYEIKNLPRLLQLARAGLVPEDMVWKMTNILKDPKRFGVSPKIRNQLYDLMIKTLNYIVVSDPAAWARFRAFLMNEEMEKEMKENNIKNLFKKAIRETVSEINGEFSKERTITEARLQEAAAHQPGEHWEASTGESWAGKNERGETVYYSKAKYPDAKELAAKFAGGKISKEDALAAKRKVEGKRKGQLYGTGGAKAELKKAKASKATDKNLDGPETKDQAIGSDPKKEKEIATRVFKIAEVMLDREKRKQKGEDVGEDPTFDLCTVTVPGTNLFCGESLEIARKKMPQLKTKATPGSPAEELLRKQLEKKGKEFNPKEEVDAEGAFLEHLKDKGVKFTTGESMDSTAMKATQNELVGAKVMSMVNALARPDEVGIPKEVQPKVRAALTAPLIVSKDGYVLDGHHRWAAVAVMDLMKGNGQNPTKIPVIRVDMNIEDLVQESNDWGNQFGLERKTAKQQASGEEKTKKEEKEATAGEQLHESLSNTIRTILKEELAKFSLYG